MSKQLVCQSVVNIGGCDGGKASVTINMYSDGSKEVVTDGDVDPGTLDMILGSMGMSMGKGPSKGSQCSLGGGEDSSLKLESCKEGLSPEEANRVREVFQTFDVDKGGTLDSSELKAMCTELIGNEVSASATMSVLEAMDKNKDRQISLEELLSFWPGIHAFLQNALESGAFKPSSTPTTKPITEVENEGPVPSTEAKRELDTSSVPGEGGSILTDVEKDVFHEINIARTQPKLYAELIEKQATLIKDGVLYEPGAIPIRLNEGIGAWHEAAADLHKQQPLPALKEVPLGLYLASKDHCRDQAASGATGHTGKDGSSPSGRCQRYGKWISSCGENISYGGDTGRAIVMQLIIDDGVPSRGHRKNIYNNWSVCGVACGPHPTFRFMCTQNFAGGYTEGNRGDVKLKKALDQALKENSMSASNLKPAEAKSEAKAAAPGGGTGAAKIKVYGRDSCGRCHAVYDALDSASVPFIKADIDSDKSFFGAMQASGFKGGRFGLPVVVTGSGKAIWEVGDPHALAAELASSLDVNNSTKGGNEGRGDEGEVIKVFSMQGCGRCTAMYRLLDNVKVAYEKLDIDADESYFKAMVASGFTGGSFSVPVVVVGNKAHWDIEDMRELANQLAGPSACTAPMEHLESAILPTFGKTLTPIILDIFKKHDRNQDGQLSKDETHTFLDDLYQVMGLETRCDEIQRKEIVELFREHDIDRNHKLSVKELASYLCNSHFADTATKKSHIELSSSM